jgi:Mrp family chromosome partitioning ATPase
VSDNRRGRGGGSGGGARTEKRPARDPRSADNDVPEPRNTLPGMTALRWRPEDEGGGALPAVGPALPTPVPPSASDPSLEGPTIPVPPSQTAIATGARTKPVTAPPGPTTTEQMSSVVVPPMGPPPAEPEPRRAPGGRMFGPPNTSVPSSEMVWKTQVGLPQGMIPPVGVMNAAGQTITDMRSVGEDPMSTVPRQMAPPAAPNVNAGATAVRPAMPAPATTQVTVYKLERPVEFDRRLVMLREPDSAAAAAYRVLRYRLTERGNPRVIVVSSPRAKEGKTTCAVNLALALGECGRARVLLVEANLRAPKLAEMLAFMPPQCFGEQVAAHRDQPDEPWVVVEAHSPWLHVAAVKPDQKDRPLIDAPAFAIAIDQLRHAGYDYVVIDTPPVLGTADVNLTQDSSDGVLLVVKARQTAGRHLRRSIEQLAPARILGLVMNDLPK